MKLSERAERVLLFFYERHSLAHSPIARVAAVEDAFPDLDEDDIGTAIAELVEHGFIGRPEPHDGLRDRDLQDGTDGVKGVELIER